MTVLGLLLGAAWGVVAATPLARMAARGSMQTRAIALASRPARPQRHRRLGFGVAASSGTVGRVVGSIWTRARGRGHAKEVERAVPLALDVLTVASRSGLTPRLALAATAEWSPPPLGEPLQAVEQQCRLGATLGEALDHLARSEPALAGVAEALAVADRSGAPTADLLARLADDARNALRRRSEAHARRVPVRLLFPLVFLVLPAFGLLTVVPALLAGLRSS